MTNPQEDTPLHTLMAGAYAAAREVAGPAVPIVVLHVGTQQAAVAVGDGTDVQALHTLPIGLERTAREHFRRDLPTPLEMENAIATVEDAVMPLHRLLPRSARLFTQDAALHGIATLAGRRGTAALSLDAMEACFNQLASVVMGTPAANGGLPQTRDFATGLLILRELMHHLHFEKLEFVN